VNPPAIAFSAWFTLFITSLVSDWSTTSAAEIGTASVEKKFSRIRRLSSYSSKSRHVRPPTSWLFLSRTCTGTMTKFTFTRKVLYCCSSSLPGWPISGAPCWTWPGCSALSAASLTGVFGFPAGCGAACCAGGWSEEEAALLSASVAVPGVRSDAGTPCKPAAFGVGASGTACCFAACCWPASNVANTPATNH
jgi:hypothetical protein